MLPDFAYHPDPVDTGSVVPATEPCSLCNQARGYLYAGPVYAVDEVEATCPWCIADGTLARAHEADLTTVDGAPEDVPAEVVDEVLHRTPGFAGWQQERWLFHCGDAAAYLGRVGYDGLAGRPDALEALRADGTPDELVRALSREGDATGYLFRCRSCATHLAYADHL